MPPRKKSAPAPMDDLPIMTASAPHAALSSTAEVLGKDLLSAIVDEVKAMPDAWPKLNYVKQDELIERLRRRVRELVAHGLDRLLRGQYPAVAASVDAILVKKGIVAKLTIDRQGHDWHEVIDAVGTNVLLVLADPEEYLQGMEEIKAVADQRDLFLADNNKVETHAESLRKSGKSFNDLMNETKAGDKSFNDLPSEIKAEETQAADLLKIREMSRDALADMGFGVFDDFFNHLTAAAGAEIIQWLKKFKASEAEGKPAPTPVPHCVHLAGRKVVLPENRAVLGKPKGKPPRGPDASPSMDVN